MSHLPRKRAILKQAPSGPSTDSTAQRTHRAPDRFSTSHYPAAMQQPDRKPKNSPRLHTHTRVPHTGPYAPNQSTPASSALTVSTGSRSLRTGRVPGQPGLARPPAPSRPQPRRRRSKAPNTNTAQVCLARHPGASPLNHKQQKLPATRPRLPRLTGAHPI